MVSIYKNTANQRFTRKVSHDLQRDAHGWRRPWHKPRFASRPDLSHVFRSLTRRILSNRDNNVAEGNVTLPSDYLEIRTPQVVYIYSGLEACPFGRCNEGMVGRLRRASRVDGPVVILSGSIPAHMDRGRS